MSLPKTKTIFVSQKIKLLSCTGLKILWPAYTTIDVCKKKRWCVFFPDDFGLRGLVIQKPFQPKKGIP